MVLGEVAVLGKLEEALQVLSNLKNPIRSMFALLMENCYHSVFIFPGSCLCD